MLTPPFLLFRQQTAAGQCLLHASVTLQYELLCTGGLETVTSSRCYGYLESCCTLLFCPAVCMEYLLLRHEVGAIGSSAASWGSLLVNTSHLEERSNTIDFSECFQPTRVAAPQAYWSSKHHILGINSLPLLPSLYQVLDTHFCHTVF